MAQNSSDLFKAIAQYPSKNTVEPPERQGALVQDALVKTHSLRSKDSARPGKKAIHELTPSSQNALNRDPSDAEPLDKQDAHTGELMGAASTHPTSDSPLASLDTGLPDAAFSSQGTADFSNDSRLTGNLGASWLVAQADTNTRTSSNSIFSPSAPWAWLIPATWAGVSILKSSSSNSDTVTKLRVVDGPVKDAKVYVDLDDDGVIDEGEPEVGSTDSTGFATVTLTAEQAKHALLARGGTDTETNKAFSGVLAAPAGSSVINPLTTLVAAMMEGGQSLADAKAAVVTALGLTGVSDLTSYDTFAQASTPEGMANHLKAVQIANIIVAGSALAASDSSAAAQTGAASRVIDALASKIASISGAVVFDAAVLTDVLTTAGATSHAASVAAAIEAVNTVVANASGPDALAQVAQAQVLAQVTLTNAIKTADDGGLDTVTTLQTNAAQMAVQIDAKSTDTLAPTLAITSDKDTLKSGETATITFTFSEDPGSSFAWDGTVGDVVVSGGVLSAIRGSGLTRSADFTSTAGTHGAMASITVAGSTYLDAAGNTGVAGTTPAIRIDMMAPLANFSAIQDANGDLLTAGPTTSTTLLLSGSNELGSTVRVYNGSDLLGLATVTGTDWRYTVTASNAESYKLKITETDLAGNVSAPKAYLTGAGDAVLDLGVVNGVDYGQLIAPVQVDGGQWFYHWDRNGNNVADDADVMSRFEINQIFNEDINGEQGTGTTDTVRFATLNGLHLALPTLGLSNANTDLIALTQVGTAVGSATKGVGDNTVNTAYDDLLAIWDAYNGDQVSLQGVEYWQDPIGGLPPNWLDYGTGVYASATPSFVWGPDDLTRHYTFMLGAGAPSEMYDGTASEPNTSPVAVQVFEPRIVIDTRGAPVLTGAATAGVQEGSTGTVYTAFASQAGSTLTYALGGADAALFNINASTGAVDFLNPPDFEAPGDVGVNNVYDITVTASNGVYTSLPKAVAITVGNVYEAPVMVTGASWATSFNEGALSSKLHIDVPEPSRANVVLDTGNQQLDFSAKGSHGLEAYYYRDDAPIVWADLPEVQLGQSWSVQTRVSINDGLAVPQQSAGIAFYDADGGVPNFYFSLTQWIQSTYSLSDVAGVAIQSGGGHGISGEAYSLLAPETSDVYLKIQVTELGQTDHYQFFYKGLLAQDPWIAVGDARTYTSKGNDSRVGLFYKTNQVTAGATFDDFAITVPVSVAENSTGTVYTANAVAEGGNTLTYALSGNDSALFSIHANTGALAFKAAPNFEAPLDNDGDNQYDLTVTASDGVATTVPQSVVIAVTNVVEQSAVNVTVAPAQVAEGDAGKLVYTFTRSNDLVGEMTVNIGVTGTAGNEDYARPLQSQWTRLIGASRYSQGQPSAAVGADGVYVSGRADSALLDGTNVLSESGGGYVRKFDADSSLVWTRLIDAVNDNYPYSVTTGTDGGVYVAGMAYNPAQSNYDGFVNKFDAAGTLTWTRFVGTLEYDYIQSVSTDDNGTVCVAGLTYSSQTGTYSTFLSKLESDGVVAWTRPFASGYSSAISVSAAADGAVFVTGYSQNAFVDEDENPLSNAGSYVSKYGADGNLEWTRLPDASGSSQTNSITTGADGAVYVAGYSYGSILNGDVSQGGQDGFVSKFDAAGELVWTRLVSGSGNDVIKSVFTGEDGAIYVAGETNSSLNGQVIQGAPNTTNGFVSKLDADDGALAWTHLMGGSSNDLIKSVSVDADGVVYVAGETYSSSLNGQNNQGNVAGFVSKILPAASLTQVTFAPGSATATLALRATSDAVIEGNDTVTLTVKPGQANTVGSSASATGTIEDMLESDGTSVNINSRTNGNISVDGETDLYSIQLTKGEKYVFTLEANSPGLDAGLNLFTTRSASSESLLQTNDNAFYSNNNSRITYTAQETGNHYIQAHGVSGTSGDYVLSFSDKNVPKPSRIAIPNPPADAASPNPDIQWKYTPSRGTGAEFYLIVDAPKNSLRWTPENLPYWTDSENRSLLVNIASGEKIEHNGDQDGMRSGTIFEWDGPTVQSHVMQDLSRNTDYVYVVPTGAITGANGLTNDYYESTIYHTTDDAVGPKAISGGVIMDVFSSDVFFPVDPSWGHLTLDAASPNSYATPLIVDDVPDLLWIQFDEKIRSSTGGWNQGWAAKHNDVFDGVYLKENGVAILEFDVNFDDITHDPNQWGAPFRYPTGLLNVQAIGSEVVGGLPWVDSSGLENGMWLNLHQAVSSWGGQYAYGDYVNGYEFKEGVTYTLVVDAPIEDLYFNVSDVSEPLFEFSFMIDSAQQPLVFNVASHIL